MLFDRVKSWNAFLSDNNGLWGVCTKGRVFSATADNAVITVSLFEMNSYLSNVPVNEKIFALEKSSGFKALYKFVYPDGDDAGHLFADQFGGSPDLDNLVSQRSDINRAVKNTDNYCSMKREWSKALKSGQKVTDVDIKLTYENGLSQPSAFDVSYKIDDFKITRHCTQ